MIYTIESLQMHRAAFAWIGRRSTVRSHEDVSASRQLASRRKLSPHSPSCAFNDFRLALLKAQAGSSPMQRAAQSLLVLLVHARDVLKWLQQSKCGAPSCFEWTKQLRYYWQCDVEDCDVEQLQAKYVQSSWYKPCAGKTF